MSQLRSQILESNSPQRTQEMKAKIRNFKNILQEVGIDISFSENPHILKQEQSLVLRDLEKLLQTSNDTCEEFVNGLKILCKKEKHFRKVLMLTQLKKGDAGERIRSERIEQESLMR